MLAFFIFQRCFPHSYKLPVQESLNLALDLQESLSLLKSSSPWYLWYANHFRRPPSIMLITVEFNYVSNLRDLRDNYLLNLLLYIWHFILYSILQYNWGNYLNKLEKQNAENVVLNCLKCNGFLLNCRTDLRKIKTKTIVVCKNDWPKLFRNNLKNIYL